MYSNYIFQLFDYNFCYFFQVWVYVEDVDRFVDSLTWSNYGEVFPHIWVIRILFICSIYMLYLDLDRYLPITLKK